MRRNAGWNREWINKIKACSDALYNIVFVLLVQHDLNYLQKCY